uniref:Uncharacterized protein n=1 Tax=Cacopsylla melanoneura TaxID=428564 RepID=A0A8D8ZX53_9HEMI
MKIESPIWTSLLLIKFRPCSYLAKPVTDIVSCSLGFVTNMMRLSVITLTLTSVRVGTGCMSVSRVQLHLLTVFSFGGTISLSITRGSATYALPAFSRPDILLHTGSQTISRNIILTVICLTLCFLLKMRITNAG